MRGDDPVINDPMSRVAIAGISVASTTARIFPERLPSFLTSLTSCAHELETTQNDATSA